MSYNNTRFAVFTALITCILIVSCNKQASFSKKNVPVKTMLEFDSKKFADSLLKENTDVLFFAKSFKTNFTFNNSGKWYVDKFGKHWKLKIISKKAYSLNVILENFKMAPGCYVLVSSSDYKHRTGKFTHEYNNEAKIVPVQLIPGEEIVVEYFQPKNVKEKSSFTIANVNHDVINAMPYATGQSKSLGESNPCHANINCTEGADWQDEKRSVVRILIQGGRGFCTGAVINNVNNNKAPYVLSAAHCGYCLNGNDWKSIFYFNYEYPGCSKSGWISDYMLVNGAQLKALGPTSDFALLEMVTTIPSSYHPYFAGWSIDQTLPIKGAGIHHPKGDAKVISTFGVYPLKNACGEGSYRYECNPSYRPMENFIEVFWARTANGVGFTENGSSGSPLFSSGGYIIGQLRGKCETMIPDPCNNNRPNTSVYGWLRTSWTNSVQGQNLLQLLAKGQQNSAAWPGYSPSGWRHAVIDNSENVVQAVRSIALSKTVSQEVFYRNQDNRILGYFWANNRWNTYQISDWDLAKRVGGDLVAGSNDFLFYRGVDGRLRTYYRNIGWLYDRIDKSSMGNLISASPGSMAVGNNNNVYYRGSDNYIHRYYWDASIPIPAWKHQMLSNINNVSEKCAGDLIVNENGTQPFYRGTDGKMHTYWNNGTNWIHIVLSNTGGSSGHISPNSGSMDFLDGKIIYRGADNHLQMFHYNGVWNHGWVSHSPSFFEWCGGIVTVSPHGNIYYQGADGKMHQFVWNATNTNWDHGILEGSSQAPFQHDVDYALEVLQTGQIFYRGRVDGKLHSYYWANM